VSSRVISAGAARIRTLLISVAAMVLIGLFPACLRNIPEGQMGAAGARLLPPGRHLVRPFQTVRLVPLAGDLAAIDLDRTTAEGAALRVRLTLRYRLDPERLRPHADELATAGLEGLVASVARIAMPALAVPAATPHPGTVTPEPVSPSERESVRRALVDAGVEPVEFDLRSGLAAAFPPAAAVTAAGSGGAGRVGGTASAGGGKMPERIPTGLRVVLIGLDGADWNTIDPLVRAGRMPHLAKLLARGVRGPLRSYDPMISPLLWTTMATGKGPDEHGVADFQAVDTQSGRRIPITSRFRKVKALWNILGDAGATSAFVAWWASYPAEEVRGFQISNLVAFETLRPRAGGNPFPAGITWPRDYLATLGPRLKSAADLKYEDVRPILHIDRAAFDAARADLLAPPPDPSRASSSAASSEVEESGGRKAVQKPIPLALSILTGSLNYAIIGADLAARRPDLAAIYFEGIDMMGHRFQHCMPPRLAICSEEEARQFGDAVTGFYAYQDALIGDIVRTAGDDATFMVVSDHGFRSGAVRPADALPYTTQQPVEWHAPNGIFLLSGPGARRAASLGVRPTLFDIAPTLLHLAGLPAARDMPGRVLTEALEPGFAAAHPVRGIASYETIGPERHAPSIDGGPESRQAESDLLASLRSLGYIGGDNEGTVPAAGSAGVATGAASGGSPGADPGAGTQVFYHRNLATYFLKRQDYAHAAEQLRLANARQRLPKNDQMLSEAYLGMGDKAAAQAALRDGLAALPTSDIEPLLWLVQLDLDAPGGAVVAEADARRYAARSAAKPGLDDAVSGLLLERRGETAEALRHFRQAFAADPLRVLVAQRLYALEPAAQRQAVLLPALASAVARDPRLDEYHDMLGGLHAEAGRDREALAAFRKACDLDPDNPRFVANLAGTLARLGQWGEAAAAYERSASLQPSAATSLKLGSVYRRLGQHERALAAFQSARALGDDSAGPILGIALAQSELNRLPEALATLRDGRASHPEDTALTRLEGELRARKTGPASGAAAKETRAGVAPGGR
jgi:tetratricopeptide (TPR) repeat protein